MAWLYSVCLREVTLSLRNPGSYLNALLFACLVCTLFAVALGPEPLLLAKLAPSLLCVTVLLSVLLAVDGLFRHDYVDGSLEQMLLSPHSLYFAILLRLLSQAVLIALPLALISPLLALMLGLAVGELPTVVALLFLAIPTLVFIGAIGAALTVSFERSGLLMALLSLPLYIPVLIFTTAALQGALLGASITGQVALLGGLLLLALALSPLAIVASLRLNFYH